MSYIDHGPDYQREVLPPCRRLQLGWLARVIAIAALILAAEQIGVQIGRRREAVIDPQPWPCEYDRGVLDACRPHPIAHADGPPIVRR